MMRIKPIYDLAEVPEVFGLDIVARLLMHQQERIVQYVKAGILPARRVDGQWVFERDELFNTILSL